jgi:hypothetical protein
MSSQLSLARKCATDAISASDENGAAFRSPLATIIVPTVNRTGMSQLSNLSSAYKKGRLSTTERANHLFQLCAEMDAHDRANDGDDEVELEDVVVPKTAPVDLDGGISYPNPETPNFADIGVFGANDDDESDSDSDSEEEDNGDAVGDGQDCLHKALVCYDAVRIAPGCRTISNPGGGNIFHVDHKELTKSLSPGQSKFNFCVCVFCFFQILPNLSCFLSTARSIVSSFALNTTFFIILFESSMPS